MIRTKIVILMLLSMVFANYSCVTSDGVSTKSSKQAASKGTKSKRFKPKAPRMSVQDEELEAELLEAVEEEVDFLATDALEPEEDTSEIELPTPKERLQPRSPLGERDHNYTSGSISWMAYNYQEATSTIKIEMTLKGNPRYDITRSMDNTQGLLTVRFWDTQIPTNLKYGIDTSEFRSSISYIRAYEKKQEGALDVVITLRDPEVEYKLERKFDPTTGAGEFVLLFPILPKYKTLSVEPQSVEPVDKAEFLDKNYNIRSGSDYTYIDNAQFEVEEFVSFNVGQAGIQDVLDYEQPLSDQTIERTPDALAPVSNDEAVMQKVGDVTEDILGNDIDSKDHAKYVGKPVQLEFNKASLRQVLQTFSDQTGVNFIFSEEVGNTAVTIRLIDVPWDAALAAILDTYKLTIARVGDNVVRVDQIDTMTKYLESKDQVSVAKLLAETPKVLVIKLSNTKAEVLAPQLKELLLPGKLAEKAKISVDVRTNSLLFEAPVPILAKAKLLVERLDIPIPQVEIASRIVEVSKDNTNVFGINWNGGLGYNPNRGLGFGTLNFPNYVNSNFQVGSNVKGVGKMSVQVGSLNDVIDLDLMLGMEESRGNVEVLQSNKVVVRDREKATISAGDTHYFPQLIGSGEANQQSLGSVEYLLQLDVTPEVTTDGRVGLDLNVVSDAPSPAGAVQGAPPVKNSRNLTTKLMKKSGETAVIGGIFNNRIIKNITGIPFLSYIPIIGALFRSTTESETRTELMVMITPTIRGYDEPEIINQGTTPSVTPAPTTNQADASSNTINEVEVTNTTVEYLEPNANSNVNNAVVTNETEDVSGNDNLVVPEELNPNVNAAPVNNVATFPNAVPSNNVQALPNEVPSNNAAAPVNNVATGNNVNSSKL